MRYFLLVGIGGFIGSILRYALSRFMQQRFISPFPVGTISVNIIGCLAIGIVFALADKNFLSSDSRLFLATGICGGFTTFSAFSIETITLIRESEWLYASLYVISSVLLGLLATFGGYLLGKNL
jgi:fluoride exporter